MQVGDVLFYKGTSLISKVISWVTKSPYTHVALVIGDGIVLEAQRFTKSKIRDIEASEVYEVYRIPGLSEERKRNIQLIGLTYKDRGYDYLEMIALILRAFFKTKSTWFERRNKVFCSEVIDYIFYASGVQRWLKVNVGDVYPHELIQVYNLRKVTEENLQLISDK